MPQSETTIESDLFIRFCLTDAENADLAISVMTEQFASVDPQAILIFAGANLEPIVAGMRDSFPECPTIGCSTAGEIGSGGFSTKTVSAIALGKPAKAATYPVKNLTEFRYEQGSEILDKLCHDLGIAREELVKEPKRFVFVILADGLSGMEEVLIASLMVLVPNVQLVGGSAGDNFVFEQTHVACSGQVHSHGAVIMLLEPGKSFHAFAGHHYEPTSRSVVVTSADPENRLIHRIDGKPANLFVADILGLTPEQLAADEIGAPMDSQIVLGVQNGEGQQYFNRAVMRVQGGSILMGGAMEEGTILTLMEPTNLIDHAKAGMASVRASCKEPIGQVLFDCGGRLALARAEGCVTELAEIVTQTPTAGFTTYGEFFGPLLLNLTLTGIIFDGAEDG